MRGTWPDIPPEVPPPRRPGEPEPPERPDRPAPYIPLVPPAQQPRRDEDWQLLEHRTVLLTGPLDDATGTRVAAQLMTLDADGSGEISLHIACHDAELRPSLMLAETIDLLSAPVVTVGKGVVGGAALAPFAAADRRVASPHAAFRLSEPHASVSGAASDITREADEVRRQVQRLHHWIADASGRPVTAVGRDMERGRVLDAAQALEYGLVDEVAGSGRSRG